MRHKLLIIHGPNINLLGERETQIYGRETLDAVNADIYKLAEKLGFDCEIYHTNIEGEIIDKLHSSRKEIDGIILNAGAYTHYSIAIRDAIAAIKLPCIEVHFSNIFAREEFRSKSVIAPVCAGTVSGFGKHSYTIAMHGIKAILE